MKLFVVAVGQRVPDWAQTAWDDYAKRFPPELRVELKAVKTEPRASKTLETLYAAERQRIEAAIPKGVHVVALRTTAGEDAVFTRSDDRLRTARTSAQVRTSLATPFIYVLH